MNDRRSFLVGASGALLGAAALPDTAKAGPDELAFIYVAGVVWNPTLPDLLGKLRLNVYLAVKPDGTGTGTVSDPVYTQINSHVRVLRTVQSGNTYEFHGQIEESNDPTLLGQPVVIPASAHGEATILNLLLGNNVFPGLGLRVFRVTNVRIDATIPPPR